MAERKNKFAVETEISLNIDKVLSILRELNHGLTADGLYVPFYTKVDGLDAVLHAQVVRYPYNVNMLSFILERKGTMTERSSTVGVVRVIYRNEEIIFGSNYMHTTLPKKFIFECEKNAEFRHAMDLLLYTMIGAAYDENQDTCHSISYVPSCEVDGVYGNIINPDNDYTIVMEQREQWPLTESGNHVPVSLNFLRAMMLCPNVFVWNPTHEISRVSMRNGIVFTIQSGSSLYTSGVTVNLKAKTCLKDPTLEVVSLIIPVGRAIPKSSLIDPLYTAFVCHDRIMRSAKYRIHLENALKWADLRLGFLCGRIDNDASEVLQNEVIGTDFNDFQIMNSGNALVIER